MIASRDGIRIIAQVHTVNERAGVGASDIPSQQPGKENLRVASAYRSRCWNLGCLARATARVRLEDRTGV